MDDESLIQEIVECKKWMLSQAAKHEKAACIALYSYEKSKENNERAEQKTILKYVTTLNNVLHYLKEG